MRFFQVLIFSLSLLFSLSVYAKSEIYKCTDQFGRPTYTTQPSCDNPETVGKRKKDKKNVDKKNKLVDDNRKKLCAEAQETLKSYKSAPFLTKTVKNNEGKSIKVRLSKQEREQTIQDSKDEVDYWCQ